MSAAPDTTPATPLALLALAERAAETGAELLRASIGRADLTVATKSSATDMVTDVDRAVEVRIVEALLLARPDDGVAGEEHEEIRGTSGVRWLVDPIDGTTNFVYGYPGFNVSVAAELEGTVVAGCVIDPLHGDVFTASAGGGAARNGQALHVRLPAPLAAALIATGFSYERERRRRQAHVLAQVLPAVRDLRRGGAAAVDLCWVGCGRVDAYFERGLQPWDLAAGGLVASEAGAVVGDLFGGPASADGCVVAAPPGLFEPLCELLRDAGAGEA